MGIVLLEKSLTVAGVSASRGRGWGIVSRGLAAVAPVADDGGKI
jgi:hypothetical protein